jgi:serine/threonine-protein phosphatase 2A regulatory subunit A
MDFITPFEFFKKETSHVDAVIRTEAMYKVSIIAAVMGPDQVRATLLPYLLTTVGDLDQVILALAQKISKFLPLVGGPDQALSLIPIIEAICEVEEITIRDAIVASACKIIQQIGPNHKSQVQAFFDLIKRISSEEAGELFYSRVSCCHMVADLYFILNEADQVSLREIYTRLCKDELSIVRRAASLAFIHIAKVADPETLSGEFLELLKLLCQDESQTIQVTAVESLCTYAGLLKKIDNTTALSADLLLLVKTYAEDPSWRIRQSMSKQYSLFAACFSANEVSEEVFPSLVHLVHDPEPEVRSVAILEVLPFLEVVGIDRVLDELLPVAVHIVEDPVVNMRKVLADLCIDLACKSGDCDPSRLGSLHDLIIKIMDDEDPLVRLRVIKKLPLIAEESPALCSRLKSIVKEMYSNTNWRVRKELLLAMPAIVLHMGEEHFSEHFLDLVLKQLTDGVHEVREACTTAIYKICALSNGQHEFVYEKLFPAVRDMSKDIFLVRLSMLTCLKGLIQIQELPEAFMEDIITLMAASCADKVVNIRIRAAQALSFTYLLPHITPYRERLDVLLAQLKQDKDRDVKFFSDN